MKLSEHSRNRILETFKTWGVPKDFADPMYNYLVHGYSPGSCFTSVLANDFAGAIARSHPANTIEAFKALSGWINDTMPAEAFGSYKEVSDWCYLKGPARRKILEGLNLIYSVEDEMMLVLQGERTHEPVLY
jgi:hypothetical protein